MEETQAEEVPTTTEDSMDDDDDYVFFDCKATLEKLKARMEFLVLPFCNDVHTYENFSKIGQGTFGEVFKGSHRSTAKVVALKKVFVHNANEGFPMAAIREVKFLRVLKHENIISLIEICCSSSTESGFYRSNFYLVFEFCDHDLSGLLSHKNVKFNLGEKKMIMKQFLNGLFFIHNSKILHRDLKAANILFITNTGSLKIADFGLARAFSESKEDKPNLFTNKVVTLWYRPPEILLGATDYGFAVDLWGVGMIMGELWTISPLIQGSSEQQQLVLISHLCGSITLENLPQAHNLPLFHNIELPRNLKRRVTERLMPYIKEPFAVDLIDKFLSIDPEKRVDCDTALDHDFFWVDPLPCCFANKLKMFTESMYEFSCSKERYDQRKCQDPETHPPPPPPGYDDHNEYDLVF